MDDQGRQILTIFRTACDSQYGVIVRTDNAALARVVFYDVRKEIGDVEFNQLVIRVSPDDTEHELWLIKNAASLLNLNSRSMLDA